MMMKTKTIQLHRVYLKMFKINTKLFLIIASLYMGWVYPHNITVVLIDTGVLDGAHEYIAYEPWMGCLNVASFTYGITQRCARAVDILIGGENMNDIITMLPRWIHELFIEKHDTLLCEWL